ncbi:cellulose synthase operon protein YhjQ/BcsQ [Komagataeibacter europaeus]|uniref:cellulose synthase operon protein YhjQ/BcsQ n=1 Tax=Komagataeibacter europaeus TaxID=33995 RepID=UPI0021756190|nr:cellulose synthase operon protein YhjQ/BcsQ [Komagataeibacter europaeus]
MCRAASKAAFGQSANPKEGFGEAFFKKLQGRGLCRYRYVYKDQPARIIPLTHDIGAPISGCQVDMDVRVFDSRTGQTPFLDLSMTARFCPLSVSQTKIMIAGMQLWEQHQQRETSKVLSIAATRGRLG